METTVSLCPSVEFDSRVLLSPPRARLRPSLALGPVAAGLSAGLAASTALPAGIALGLTRTLTAPGDMVLALFTERPATVAQIVWEGRQAWHVGLDRLSGAAAIAGVSPAPPREALKRLRELQNDMFYGDPDSAPFPIRYLVEPLTLSQLIHLRQHLDTADPIDATVVTAVMGWLEDRQAAWRKEGLPLHAPTGDVFGEVARRVNRQSRPTGLAAAPLRVARADGDGLPGRDIAYFLRERPARLALIDPPPLVSHLAQAESIRRWMAVEPLPACARQAMPPGDAPGYLAWLAEATRRAGAMVEAGGWVIVVADTARIPHAPKRQVATAERLLESLSADGAERWNELRIHAGGLGERRRLLALRRAD